LRNIETENQINIIQNQINNILKKTNSISKITGKDYAKVLYEDSPFFREIKRINRMGLTKAGEELVSFQKERVNGTTKLTPQQAELKIHLALT
jgi:hypothetical protein